MKNLIIKTKISKKLYNTKKMKYGENMYQNIGQVFLKINLRNYFWLIQE